MGWISRCCLRQSIRLCVRASQSKKPSVILMLYRSVRPYVRHSVDKLLCPMITPNVWVCSLSLLRKWSRTSCNLHPGTIPASAPAQVLVPGNNNNNNNQYLWLNCALSCFNSNRVLPYLSEDSVFTLEFAPPTSSNNEWVGLLQVTSVWSSCFYSIC